ncbi:MAG: recombination protein RecR [Chlamydiales bacterium]|nr:recombination protein RecR [Chlamydiales bacterium]
MSKYPSPLVKLIANLKKFPGVGGRTAERFAFHLLGWSDHELSELAESISTAKARIRTCPECHCLMDEKRCDFCDLTKRETSQMCVISSAKDLFAIEETGSFRGLYHVLGGLLSPLEGKHPQNLNFEGLKRRIRTHNIQEIIVALDSTLEGDTTALYLREQLQGSGIKISRLAFGLPMGSSLDFVDGGTLLRAFSGRQGF